VVNGFTITNGRADNGGAIRCSGASPTIRNCLLTANASSADGGGIYCESGSPVVLSCAITGTEHRRRWGSLSGSGDPRMVNCTIAGNTAAGPGGGGGLLCQTSNPVVERCLFIGNAASYVGGGLLSHNSAPDVSYCTFEGNSAHAGAGLDVAFGSQGRVHHNLVVGNRASLAGAVSSLTIKERPQKSAQHDRGQPRSRIRASVVRGWRYPLHPADTSSQQVRNNIIAGNLGGGGVRCASAEPILTCNDIWGNVGGDDICGIKQRGQLQRMSALL